MMDDLDGDEVLLAISDNHNDSPRPSTSRDNQQVSRRVSSSSSCSTCSSSSSSSSSDDDDDDDDDARNAERMSYCT